MVPAAHTEHVESPEVFANWPAKHGEHAVAVDVDEMVPTPQIEQTDCPVVGAYVPRGHEVHEAPALADVEYIPLGQGSQLVRPVEGEYVPDKQSGHVVAPSADEAVPMAHVEHMVSPGVAAN